MLEPAETSPAALRIGAGDNHAPDRGEEPDAVAAALQAAETSYRLHPGDDRRAASAIVGRVGWSVVRARWFLSVNRDWVRQTMDRLAAERLADR